MNRSMTDNLMIVIPLKVTRRHDMFPPLNQYIQQNSTSHSSTVRQDLKRLSSIRNCIASNICKHYAHKSAIDDNVLRDCQEYHAMLMECERIGLPIKEDLGMSDLEISWECAFQRNGQLMIRSNIRHERICVLFNIAALESYLGSIQDLNSKQGLAKAVQKYNIAAGIVHLIRTQLLPKDPYPSLDLTPSCLAMCESILLAQAQACVYDMARSTSIKPLPSLLAKLAMGAAEYYGEAVLHANDRMIQSQMEDYRITLTKLKLQSACFRALSEFHESIKNRQEREFGNEIARLTLTEQLCLDGLKIGKSEHLEVLKRVCKERNEVAKKDNSEIYRALVPNSR